MIVLILYCNLLNIYWLIKCIFLNNMEPLRGLDAPGVVSAIFAMAVILCVFLYAFFYTSSILIKNLLSNGADTLEQILSIQSKYFPFRVDSFSEERQTPLNRTASSKGVPISSNYTLYTVILLQYSTHMTLRSWCNWSAMIWTFSLILCT